MTILIRIPKTFEVKRKIFKQLGKIVKKIPFFKKILIANPKKH